MAPHPPPPIHRIWRILNALAILFLLFAPWVTSCDSRSEEQTGIELLQEANPFRGYFSSWEVTRRMAIESLKEKPLSELLGLVLFLVFAWLPIYSVLNIIQVLTNQMWIKQGVRFTIASIALLCLSGCILLLIGFMSSSWLWGYWLTWIALFSSLLLEFRTLDVILLKPSGGGASAHDPQNAPATNKGDRT